jgi:hypothetical protein
MRLFITISCLLSVISLVSAMQSDASDTIEERIERAYNFDAEAFTWFDEHGSETEDPFDAFVCASASYWQYQSDRVNQSKMERVQVLLDRAVDLAKTAYKRNNEEDMALFLYGVSLCNRARFNVEEEAWFSAYLDSRKGISLLKKLLDRSPNFADANFALGVAECFLSEAPAFLKPLAMMLGFSGNAEQGIQKLTLAIEKGKWTRTEAEYYLAYYYYNVAENGAQTIDRFNTLFARYPRNPIFGYFLGRGYQINDEPIKALEVYRSVRDMCYEVGAKDIGNWTSYRIGTILQGEGLHEAALDEFKFLQRNLDPEMQRQFYFQWLPVKFAASYIEIGELDRALKYLDLMNENWDEKPFKAAKELRKSINI